MLGMLYEVHSRGQLDFVPPEDCCCNCGRTDGVALQHTPLRRTRYFMAFGSELTLDAVFAYCWDCEKSAARNPKGWLAKLLIAAMLFGVLSVIGLIAMASQTMFILLGLLSLALPFAAYAWLDRQSAHRSFTQPVSLLKAEARGGRLHSVTLRFRNARYARAFAKLNAQAVQSRFVRIVSPSQR